MALISARPDGLVSSSGANCKAWSGAGQPQAIGCSASSQQPIRHFRGYPATSQRLASHKQAASQPLVRGWLPTNWLSPNKVLVEKPF